MSVARVAVGIGGNLVGTLSGTTGRRCLLLRCCNDEVILRPHIPPFGGVGGQFFHAALVGLYPPMLHRWCDSRV